MAKDFIIIGRSEDGTATLDKGGKVETWSYDGYATLFDYHTATRIARKLQKKHSRRRDRWLFNIKACRA